MSNVAEVLPTSFITFHPAFWCSEKDPRFSSDTLQEANADGCGHAQAGVGNEREEEQILRSHYLLHVERVSA